MNCDDGSLFTLLMRVASNHVWCLMSWEVSNYHHKEIIKLMFQELTFCPNDWWRAKYSKCHLCYLLYWEYFLHLEVFFRRAFRILQIKLNHNTWNQVVFGDFVFWFKLVGVWFVNHWKIYIEKGKTPIGWIGAWKRDPSLWCVLGKSLTWNISW